MKISTIPYYRNRTQRPHPHTKITSDYDVKHTIHTPSTTTTHRAWIPKSDMNRQRRTRWSTEDKPKTIWSHKTATNTNTRRCSSINRRNRDAASCSCQIYLAKRSIDASYDCDCERWATTISTTFRERVIFNRIDLDSSNIFFMKAIFREKRQLCVDQPT